MPSTKDILQRGYFPKELPPPFNTISFADKFGALSQSNVKESLSLRYSYSKHNSIRRTLSIPNPAQMISLSNAIANNWTSIERHCSISRISRTLPVIDTNRAFVKANTLDKIPMARAESRVGARFILKADVLNFFGNVYTHAIPWAFHTKAISKQNRNAFPTQLNPTPLFGNVIDHASRSIQSGQTIGIPAGPDTSLVIGESLLCAVDAIIQSKLGAAVSGFRFVDDYEFACATLGQAEHIRTVLQDALLEYELQLNPRKTRIIELPDALDTPWAHELGTFDLSGTERSLLENQLLRYFSRAFELVRGFPGEPVLKYAVRKLSEIEFSLVPQLLQRLLLQAATLDPCTLQTALYHIFQHKSQLGEAAVDKVVLAKALSAIIEYHAPLQHGGDVAWALWGAIVFQIPLGDGVVAALNQLSDPTAVLLALHAEQDGRLSRALNKTTWNTVATTLDLFDTRWLLAYEGPGKGWLSPNTDPALGDPFFESMRRQNVSFYDANAIRQIPEPSSIAQYN